MKLGIAEGIIGGIVGVIIVLISIFAIFLFAGFGAIIGAITGFIIQIIPFLGETVIKGFAHFGIENANLVEIGAMLGFIAGFFKSAGSGKDECKM